MNGDLVPRKVRLIAYVVVILAEAATIIATAFDVIGAEQAIGISAGLGVIASGLALGYVPRRTDPPAVVERDV